MGLEPSRLRRHHIIGRGHTLAEGESDGAQVLVGLGKVGHRHIISLESLLGLERGLAHLQAHQFAGVLKFEAAYHLVGLRCLVLGAVASPVPYGNGNHRTDRESSFETVLKPVEHIGIRHFV